MNKKFLSAILFGALMVTSTGTFVSCKDYDDDIENLQGQVDATKSDLTTKVSALESSISSLQSAQSSLDSKIASTKDAAEKAALEAQKAAIAAAKADLEAAVAELKSAHDADIAEVEAAIATIKGNVEALQAFQGTTEETLDALAAADEKLAGALTELEADVVANATAIGKLEAAIDAQIKALEAYEASNDEAVAANKTAIDAVAADLKKLQDTVAGLKIADPDELAAATEAIKAAQADIAKYSSAIQEINGKLEVISSAVYTGVTHVSLVTSTGTASTPLNFISVEAITDYVFGEGLPGAVTFKKGEVETFERPITIRVSPSNANLDKDMIKIVDTELNSLAGLVDIVDMKPYTGQMAGGRAISANGLWTLTLKLKDNFDMAEYSKASFNAAKWAYINYAVMVNNTSVAERQVVSEYGITLTDGNKYSRYDLGYTVNGTNVNIIKNRWSGDSTTETENGGVTSYQEAVWNLKYTHKAIQQIDVYNYAPFLNPNWTEFAKGNSDNNVIKAISDQYMVNPKTLQALWYVDGNRMVLPEDIRSGNLALRVDAEKPFTVKMANPDNVRAFYVTLDAVNAVESAPSELVAWQSYNVSGLNTVVAGDATLKLTIPAIAEGDYIGFRVYAVNYDGTLVDPDGRAFYVYVGEQSTYNAELNLTMEAKTTSNHSIVLTPWSAGYQTYSTNGWGRATGGDFEITFSSSDDTNTTEAGIQYYNASGDEVEDLIYQYVDGDNFEFRDADGYVQDIFAASTVLTTNSRAWTGKLLGDAAKLNSIAYVGMSGMASTMRDGVTYYAHITIKGDNAQIIGRSTIAFTKELPGFPTDVAPATGMLQNGNVMVFPSSQATTVSGAQFNMNGAFDGLSSVITMEDKSSPKVTGFFYNASTQWLVLPLKYADPSKSAYATKIPVEYQYSYGAISNTYDATTQTWSGLKNHVTKYPFTIQFGNYYHETTMTLGNIAVNYPGAKDKQAAIPMNQISIKDYYNQTVDLRNAVELTPNSKEAKYLSENAKIQFITENTANGVNEYYEFQYFGKAQYDANGKFARYTKAGDTYYVFDANGQTIRKYKLSLEDCDVMVINSKKDSFTGGTVPTWIQVVYKDNLGNTITKKSVNSFTMNFVQP